MRGLNIFGFWGMDNKSPSLNRWTDKDGRVAPEFIVNADVAADGTISKRQGKTKKIALEHAHSLWAGTKMFCVASGSYESDSLYLLDGETATEICAVAGSRARVSYVELNNLVYISNSNWTGIYDLETDTIRSWGVPLPPAPSVSIVDGDLPPGTYLLTYTKVVGDQLGGNGPFLKIVIENGSRGIQLNNLPAGALAWITHPNGGKLFLAVVSSGVISRQAPEMQQLPTMGVQPPPGFVHFNYAFGRLWGAIGNKLYFSEPNQYEWFRASNFLPFTEDLVMVAPVDNGLFVNSLTKTWFVAGTTPDEVNLHSIGYGAIPGSLTYASIEGGGYEVSKNLSQLPSAVWLSPKGFVIGTNTGHLVYLTDSRIKFIGREQGACVTIVKDGISRIIGSLWGDPIRYTDNTLAEIFANNTL